jgi:beta-barrel assembly-enhancing protease
MESRLRPLLLVTALTLAVAAPLASSQDSRLPDIGSSAGELLTPAKQAEYGGMLLRELRNYGYLLEDPLITDWLQTMGNQLAADSDDPQQPFTFFMMKDRQINAFATLGGYIGMNAGLVLTAQREDEVAAVLSHEIAHVTQQHVLRGAERAQRDQIPILLGMLGAIVLAQAAGGSSSGDASQAAIASAMGLMQQRQIDYTRSNESEADRVGIRTLARAGYDVDAMAGFFARMAQATRSNRGSDRDRTPDYLMTHPVTTTRISEAQQRAEQLRKDNIPLVTTVPGGKRVETYNPNTIVLPDTLSDNPLLPVAVTISSQSFSRGATGYFDWARERLRVLSAPTHVAAIREYETIRRDSGKLTDAQAYGLAVAHLQGGDLQAASSELSALLDKHPDNLWLQLAMGEAESRNGKAAAANQRFSDLLKQMPNNRAIALTFAKVLNEQGGREAGQRAQAVLRPLLSRSTEDPTFQQQFGRANELAGDTARAGEAYAEAAFLNGRPEQALIQLQTLKRRDDLDYYARARVDARIAIITPQVLELRRQGIRDPDVDRR